LAPASWGIAPICRKAVTVAPRDRIGARPHCPLRCLWVAGSDLGTYDAGKAGFVFERWL